MNLSPLALYELFINKGMNPKNFLRCVIFCIFLLFFLSSVISKSNNQTRIISTLKSPQSFESTEEINDLKYSTYWTLPNIYITNWTETNKIYDWCNYKNGHYIIENVTITGVSGKNGIYVRNTTESFIIRNSQVSEGISLLRASNGKFINIFNEADIIISKGQGNFEALSESQGNLFFLLKAKCPMIANKLNVNLNDYVFKYNGD